MDQQLEIVDGEIRVGVQFYRIENRFGHQIDMSVGDQSCELRTCDEINSDWPPAPPIQDVHFEDRGETQLLFGVGMSGKTHYSVSIASKNGNELVFEFAAHIKDAPRFLGTSYTVEPRDTEVGDILDSKIQSLEHSHIQFGSSGGGKNEFQVVPQSFHLPDLNEQDLESPSPKASIPDALPATIQWGFAIKLGT